MSKSLNECNFIGNLTRDPELKYTPNGTALVDLGMAVNEAYKKGEDWVENTVFLNCQGWGELAERVSQNYHKGDRILVRAKYKLDTWEDKTTGEKRSAPRFNILQEWHLGAPKGNE